MISQKKVDIIKTHWYSYYKKYQLSLDSTNLKNATIEWRLKHIRGFINFITSQKIGCKNLVPTDVYNYLSSSADSSPRTLEHRAVCIRFFLNYLFKKKVIHFNGTTILPKIHCNKESKIISYYSDTEMNSLLSAIDNQGYKGKLDLAILSLLVYYGLRLQDVINLKEEDFHWQENILVITQSKNNHINSFPLIDEVKYPVLDYLKNCRKQISKGFLFIKEDDTRINDHYVYNIINRYFSLAHINVKNRKHGAHSLRHSLGTSMINHNENIYTISRILGHSNINDTKVYTKLELNKLKRVSLEVPEWKL